MPRDTVRRVTHTLMYYAHPDLESERQDPIQELMRLCLIYNFAV